MAKKRFLTQARMHHFASAESRLCQKDQPQRFANQNSTARANRLSLRNAAAGPADTAALPSRSKLELPRSPGYLHPMPIYEYHCGKCQRDSEILVRSSSSRKPKCPHCGSPRLSRKFSVFAASNGGAEASACETGGGSKGGGCCACAAGRPHRH